MFSVTDTMRDFLQRSSAIPLAIVEIVKSTLARILESIADWQSGEQIEAYGVLYPNSNLATNINTSATQIDVVDFTGFEMVYDAGGAPIDAYLKLVKTAGSQTGQFEIVKYKEVDYANNRFKQVTRAQYGTTAKSFNTGSDATKVYQHRGDLNHSVNNSLSTLMRGCLMLGTTGGPPAYRWGHCFVYAPSAGVYLMFGGYNGATYYNDLWEYNPSTRVWTQKTTATGTPPTAKHSFGASWDDTRGVLLIAGGYSGADLAEVHTYTYAAGTGGAWATKASMSQTRSLASMVYAANVDKHYIIGGIVFFGTSTIAHFNYGIYDPVGNTWNNTHNTGLRAYPILGQAGAVYNPNDGLIYFYHKNLFTGPSRYLHYIDPQTNNFVDSAFAGETPPKSTVEGATILALDEIHNRLITIGGATFANTGVGIDFGLQNNTCIYIQVFDLSLGTWVLWKNLPTEKSGRAYSSGGFISASRFIHFWGGVGDNDAIETAADLLLPIQFAFHYNVAVWRSPVLDLGSVPTVNGEWVLNDILYSAEQEVLYYAFWSDNGTSFTAIGYVEDGDAITALHRYYRVDVIFNEANGPVAPEVTQVGVKFETLEKYATGPNSFGYPPIVQSIPNTSSRIEPLKGTSSVGKFSIPFITEGGLIEELVTSTFLREKEVRIRVGFHSSEFTEDDFLPYGAGVIERWDRSRNVVTLVCKDLQLLLDTEIPPSAEGGVTSVVYSVGGIASHPVAIILDILQNRVNIRTSLLDMAEFTTARNHSLLSGWNFRRTLDKPFKAKTLIEEICEITQCFLTPKEDGRLGITIYDVTQSSVAVFDKNTIREGSIKMESGIEDISSGAKFANKVGVYFGHAASGTDDDPSDFEDVEIVEDTQSQTNWGVVAETELRPLWLGPSGATYAGDTRANTIAQRRVDMCKNGVSLVPLDTALDMLRVQVGDVVRVLGDPRIGDTPTTYTIPYTFPKTKEAIDFLFLVTDKNPNWGKKQIGWKLWRLRTPKTITATTQTEFETYGLFDATLIDLVTVPDSVQLIASGGVYVVSGVYTFSVDFGQQPEREITFTVSETKPAGTSIVYTAAVSDTGLFAGEEKVVGTIVSGGTITGNSQRRYVRIQALLTSNGAHTLTPSIQSISLANLQG